MGFFKRLCDFAIWLLPVPGYDNLDQKPLQLFPSVERPAGSPHSRCVNSPHTRNCWIDGFDINTDYEAKVPPGVLREYDFTLSNQIIAPDGYLVDGMVINGRYPAPTIEANWGDTIRVTVHNNLTNHNGTAMHWHGLRQFHTNWHDGVAGVTQCPTMPGSTQVYEFLAAQYGVSWYHSHFSLQYADGVAGAIHINGPTSMNYDEDLGPILISDWYHADAFSLYHEEVEGGPPVPDSNIMNGKGVYYCDPLLDPQCTGKQPRHQLHFEEGKTYKLGIVNTAVDSQFTFWIDGHNFTIVQTDFVPVKPYTTDTMNIGIGQRYDLIVTANASLAHGNSFWIHARACHNLNQVSTLGIIRYDRHGHEDPYTPPPNLDRLTYGCQDENTTDLIPIVTRTVGSNVNDFSAADYLEVGLQSYPNISDPNSKLHKWILANSSLYLDWEEPSLRLIAVDNDTTGDNFPPSLAPIFLDFDTGEWVYFLILGFYSQEITPRRHVPVAHPIHLHGHDFVILAQGNTTFDPKVVKPNLENPTRRDVAMLPANGYLWIAFQVDNPGAWLVHCHIAWHASSGLALQFVEQPSKIPALMQEAGVLPSFEERCEDWTAYYTTVSEPAGATQEDSGI